MATAPAGIVRKESKELWEVMEAATRKDVLCLKVHRGLISFCYPAENKI